MRNLNNLIKQTGKGLAVFITFDGYRRAVANDNKITESDILAKNTVEEYQKITKILQEKEKIIDLNNAKNSAVMGRLEEKIILLNKDLDNINLHGHNLTKDHIESINKSVTSVMDEVKLLLLDDPFGTKNNFIGLPWDLSKFESYGALEWGALAHICSSIFVLSCLWYIITAYYGDQIIIYFSLEEKYPKLSKWIKYRQKFQQYYIIVNAVIITVLSLAVMYVDITVLINKG